MPVAINKGSYRRFYFTVFMVKGLFVGTMSSFPLQFNVIATTFCNQNNNIISKNKEKAPFNAHFCLKNFKKSVNLHKRNKLSHYNTFINREDFQFKSQAKSVLWQLSRTYKQKNDRPKTIPFKRKLFQF